MLISQIDVNIFPKFTKPIFPFNRYLVCVCVTLSFTSYHLLIWNKPFFNVCIFPLTFRVSWSNRSMNMFYVAIYVCFRDYFYRYTSRSMSVLSKCIMFVCMYLFMQSYRVEDQFWSDNALIENNDPVTLRMMIKTVIWLVGFHN